MEWYWRPAVWPVANHLIHRPLRVWSLDGPGTTALDALDRSEAEDLRMPAPTAAQRHEQLTAELAASLPTCAGSNQVSGNASGARPTADPGSTPRTTCGTR